jgi:GNAT superfamily N-acetyltransferase
VTHATGAGANRLLPGVVPDGNHPEDPWPASEERPVSPVHTPTIQIRRAESWDGLDVAIALTDAFFYDPVVTWTMPDVDRRGRRLLPLFSTMAESFLPHNEVRVTGDGIGAALWLPPGAEAVPAEDAEQLGATFAALLGPDAPRLFELMELLDAHHPQEPCYYLQLVGVVPAHQGRGLGTRLMRPVLDQCDAQGIGAYLEATTPASRRLYERLGFAVTGEISPAGGPPLWPMWREPQAA